MTPEPPSRGGPGPGALALDLTRECLRLCERYVQEVVLAFGLCPWAEPALRAGQVATRVSLGAIDDRQPGPDGARDGVGDVLSFIDEFEAASAPTVEIGLLLFPRFAGGWAAFDAFGEQVRRADRARRAPNTLPAFLVATFHPDGNDQLPHPNQLLSFIRRSPDPMLQLVRGSTVYNLKDRNPDISEDVARHNWTTLTESPGGRPSNARALEDVVRAIHLDRAASYRALSPPPGTIFPPRAE